MGHGINAVCLLSGGIDSSTCLTRLMRRNPKPKVITLSIHYGQKHQREIDAAVGVSRYFFCEHRSIQLDPKLFQGAGSTLIDPDKPNPEVTYAELAAHRGISPTYVPFRNGNLLSAAAAFCLTLGATKEEPIELHYGAHAEDAAHWAYPDCTPEFNGAMAAAIYVGSYEAVRLVTPLQWMEKAEIVRALHEMNGPMHLTYSCYNGGALHCGRCPTCIARQAAFIKAGVPDPTVYENLGDLVGAAGG